MSAWLPSLRVGRLIFIPKADFSANNKKKLGVERIVTEKNAAKNVRGVPQYEGQKRAYQNRKK